MAYTTDEVALRLKTEHPELRSLDNKTLVREIVARRPEAREQIIDFDDPPTVGTKPNPAPWEGGFSNGVMNSITKPLVGGAALLASQWRETPETTAATKYANTPEQDDEAALGKDLGNAAQYAIPTPLAELRAIPALKNAGWLRAAIAAAMEGGKSNVISGAQGDTGGHRALQTVVGAAGGAMSQAGSGLEAGATKSFARAVGAEPAMVEKVREIAPDMIRNEGIRGTRASMGAQVAEKLPGASAEQVAASADTTPLDLSPASTALGVKAAEVGPGLYPILNEEEIKMLREVVDSPMFKNLKPTAQQSVIESFNKQLNLPRGTDLLTTIRESESAHEVLNGGVFAKSDMLSEHADQLDAFSAAHGGKVPLDRVVRYRQALGDAGQPGARQMPSQDPTLNRETARIAAEKLNTVLHDMGNAPTARLAAADQRFSQIKTLDGVLRDSLSKDVSAVNREHFTKYILGRLAIGGVLGGGLGAAGSGGNPSKTLEGVAGGAALAGMTNTALWNSMSAGAKLRIADAINAGHFDRAVAIFEAATSATSERGGLPRAPED